MASFPVKQYENVAFKHDSTYGKKGENKFRESSLKELGLNTCSLPMVSWCLKSKTKHSKVLEEDNGHVQGIIYGQSRHLLPRTDEKKK